MLAAAALLVLSPQNLGSLEQAVKRHPNAANYRALADAYVSNEMYDKASAAFYRASGLYGKLGDPNAAKVLQSYAERYETKISIFLERPTSEQTITSNDSHARLEPPFGCYVGAFIDREDGIDGGIIGNGQSHKDPEPFNDATAKHHAVFFTYLSYGRPFPSRWISLLKRRGAAAHIAWEPRSIGQVRDDAYLRGFARDCANSGVPIFVRFAGEMNGDWTPYHDDPEGYKQMFRIVSNVMHGMAPNVAMIWCPNDIPEDRIDRYYPGKDAVDWVGVNFYSVLFNDADRARAADWRNPADSLRYIYRTYAKDHPIMIGEWAATHRSVVDNISRPEFAVNKIGQLYSALPRLYPRVKAVHWLSMNTIEHAMPGRQLNDFSLLSEPSIIAQYRQAVVSPYYLESAYGREVSPIEYVPITSGMTLQGKVSFSAVVKSYEQRPSVTWTVNGDPSSPKTVPGTYEVSVDTRRLHTSSATISLVVRDQKGRVAGSKEVRVKLAS